MMVALAADNLFTDGNQQPTVGDGWSVDCGVTMGEH